MIRHLEGVKGNFGIIDEREYDMHIIQFFTTIMHYFHRFTMEFNPFFENRHASSVVLPLHHLLTTFLEQSSIA